MKTHPDANIFPRIPQEELELLAEDIRDNGLREPITLIEYKGEKVILDGRNRFSAAQLAGIEPTFEEAPADTDTLAFVVSKNLTRRHLNEDERGVLVLIIVKRRGVKASKGRPPKSEKLASGPVSISTAARQAGFTGEGGGGRKAVRQAVELGEAAGWVPTTKEYTPEQKTEAKAAIEAIQNRDEGVSLSKAHATVFPKAVKKTTQDDAVESLVAHAQRVRDEYGLNIEELVEAIDYGLRDNEAGGKGETE